MRALQLIAPQEFAFIDIPEPAAPREGEVLIKIHAIGICGTDVSGYLGKMPFMELPLILGHELGVEVLAIGEGVTNVKSGDRCSVEPYLNCGSCHSCAQGSTNCCETLRVLGVHCDGGMCERLTLPSHKLHPRNVLSYEQLALVEMLGIGCHAVNRAQVQPGDEVLIIGAGPIGLTVLEFARIAGAKVSIFDFNETRRGFVARTWPDVTVLSTAPAEASAHIVFDATGHAGSMSQAFRYARFTGKVVFVGITKDPVPLDDPLFHRRELTLLASRNAVASDFARILELIESGQLSTQPWISHRAAFADLPEAMARWVKPETGVVKAVVSLAQ